jgi:uncharacterized protein with HEPN domain
MSRDSASILDIYAAAQKVIQTAMGMTRPQLKANEIYQNAILYQIIIMGEATKRLSSEYREKYPKIPWKRIAGMRDILTHQYDRINFDTVWDVVYQEIPELIEMITPLIPQEKE